MAPSIILILNTSGINPGPIPCNGCGPGSPPEITGESFGSTANTFKAGNFSFKTSDIPVICPPVPTPVIK